MGATRRIDLSRVPGQTEKFCKPGSSGSCGLRSSSGFGRCHSFRSCCRRRGGTGATCADCWYEGSSESNPLVRLRVLTRNPAASIAGRRSARSIVASLPCIPWLKA